MWLCVQPQEASLGFISHTFFSGSLQTRPFLGDWGLQIGRQTVPLGEGLGQRGGRRMGELRRGGGGGIKDAFSRRWSRQVLGWVPTEL